MADDTLTVEARWRHTCEGIAQATPREWGALDQRYYDAGLALIARVRADAPHDATVEKAIDAVFAFAPTPSNSDDYLRFCKVIDALIARVRAEPPLTDDEQTNPETDLLERLKRMTRQEQWTADVLSGRKNILGGPPKAPPCAMCHGPYQFDTTIPSRVWNSVVRAAGLPEYLCLTCIVRVFAEVGASFTATLWGGKFHGLPIEFRVNWKRAQDAALVSEENTMLRGLIQELKLAQTGAPSRHTTTVENFRRIVNEYGIDQALVEIHAMSPELCAALDAYPGMASPQTITDILTKRFGLGDPGSGLTMSCHEAHMLMALLHQQGAPSRQEETTDDLPR